MNDTSTFERLEDRMLLAVSVTTGKKGLLKIVGDAAGDEVEIEGTGNASEVEVFVNTVSVGTFSGIKTIKGNLGAGDDGLFVAAINIGGALDFNMGAGADEFFVDDQGSSGGNPDGPVFIGGSVIINFGGNPGDYADWEPGAVSGITIGNNVTLAGVADVNLLGNGGDSGVQVGDINIGGFLKITLNGAGNVAGDSAEALVDDVNVGGTTILNGSASAETIRVEVSSFARRVAVSLGAGDDLLDIGTGGPNRFNADVVANFGAGTDTVDDQPGNFFAVPPIARKGPEIIV
jgi:hypothetical protein